MATRIWKQDVDGNRTELSIYSDVLLIPGERLISEGCGGGGYGDPAKRDKKKIRADLSEGWITPEFARSNYRFV